MESASASKSRGITGYCSDTIGDGLTSICCTLCSPCMLLIAIGVVFYGEYNYVKNTDDIEQIRKDMVEATGLDPLNEGKPIHYYAPGSEVKGSNYVDAEFGVQVNNTLFVDRHAQILTVTIGTSQSENTETTTCTKQWTSNKGTEGHEEACQRLNSQEFPGGHYNRFGYSRPCYDAQDCGKTWSASDATAGSFQIANFLNSDYRARVDNPVIAPVTTYGTSWKPMAPDWNACGTYISSNHRAPFNPNLCVHSGNGSPGDQFIEFRTYPPPVDGLTICSKQKGNSFEVLVKDEWYDVMVAGKKTKRDCINIMQAEADALVYGFRVVGFVLFWLGFCMMFSIVSFLADRVGQMIPCGIGQAMEDMVDCLICCVTCPPACACFLLWFGIAWLLFRPLIGGIVFAAGLCVACGVGVMIAQADKKTDQPEA